MSSVWDTFVEDTPEDRIARGYRDVWIGIDILRREFGMSPVKEHPTPTHLDLLMSYMDFVLFLEGNKRHANS